MKSPISTEQFSRLVGSIYDCAVDPERWQATLTHLREALDFRTGALCLHAVPSGASLLYVASGIDDQQLVRTSQYAADVLDLWGGAEAMLRYPVDEPMVLSALRDVVEITKNRYYAEWAKPRGLSDMLTLSLARDSGAVCSIGLGRHDSAGPIGEHEVDAARLLLPHVQRAIGISRLLDIKTIEARTFESALDAVSAGILLVDPALRIVHVNAVADTILSKADPIASERGVLTLTSRPAQDALASAVACASEDEAQLGRRGFGIPARSADGGRAVLHVLPLKPGTVRAGLSPSARAAIFVAPATMPRPAPEQALAALFDLTPAEARVFVLIAAGHSVAKAARNLGVAQSTMKTHLRRLFTKTCTSRQAELIKLAGSLALSV
jgi:DNA-binding CsgD family transcriptional regulator/PAS domain-containing protein